MAEGVGAKAQERLGHAGPELDRKNSRGVLYDEVEVGTESYLKSHRVLRGSGLGVQHPLSGHVGHYQCIGVLLRSQGPSLVAVKVERPDAGRAHAHREPEQGAHTSPTA